MNRLSRLLMKYEHRSQPLLPQATFLRRLATAAIISAGLLVLWILFGMWGYHVLAGQNWVDAFLNTSMIVGGMGPVDVLPTDAAKIFAGIYAIFSGVVFLGVFGLLAAPVYHRFLHRFHLDMEQEDV